MVEITLLGSGSKGNSTLIRSSKTAILIDAGFTCRQIGLRLGARGWSPERIDGIVISHEHSDHVTGLRVLNKKYPQNVYATDAVLQTRELEKANLNATERIAAGESFSIGDIQITPFTVPHDAVDPLGFLIEVEGLRIGHLTDVGFPTELARHHLKGCNVLVLESNHDRDMLIAGPYPWPVKQRIMSRTGHLNNSDAATLLGELHTSQLQTVILAHLSEENNSADIAGRTATAVLSDNGDAPQVIVATQREPTETIRL